MELQLGVQLGARNPELPGRAGAIAAGALERAHPQEAFAGIDGFTKRQLQQPVDGALVRSGDRAAQRLHYCRSLELATLAIAA